MTIHDDWPILQIPACRFTDDDARFHSDIIYLRELRQEIVELAAKTRSANPLPITFSDELAGIEKMARTDFDRATRLASAVTW
jgi:hypothetical protein